MFKSDDIQVRPAFAIEKLDRRLLLSAHAGIEEEVVICDRTIDEAIVLDEGIEGETFEIMTFTLTLGVDENGNEVATCGFAELPAEEEVVYEAEILVAAEGEELMYTCGFGELPIEEEAPVVDVEGEGEYEVEILVVDESAELVDPIDGYEVQILNVAPEAPAEEPAAFEMPEATTFASLDPLASSVLDSQSDDVLA
jgi:hypothetical protein